MIDDFKIIFRSEWRCCIRRLENLLHPMAFFIIIISFFPIAFMPDQNFTEKYIPAFIWIAALFAHLLSIQNIFHMDLEEGYFEQVFISALPLTAIIFIKLLVQWIMSTLPLIILAWVLGLFFNLTFTSIYYVCLSLLCATPILVMLSGFVVALTIGLNQPGILLGLIFLPLTMPLLIFSITIIQQAQAGLAVLGLLAFLFGIMLIAIIIMPTLIGYTLKLSLE